MTAGRSAANASEDNPSVSATVLSQDMLPRFSTRRPRGIRSLLGLIGLLALAINLLYFARSSNYLSPDSSSYIIPASSLNTGHGFTGSDGRPETNRTPGYPLLIALFLRAGVNLRYLVLLQHLMLVILTMATAAAAFQVSSSRRQTLIAGVLLSIDLPMLAAANAILSEILFTVILTAALWLLWTGSRASEQPWSGRLVLSGLLTGASVLIRPISLFFFLPVALYLILARRQSRLRAVLAFTLAFACFPLMWATRNYRESGSFAVSSISGSELLCCRAAGVLALNDPGDFNANVTKRRAQLEDMACKQLKTLYGKDCSELSFVQRSDYYMRLGRKVLMQHPVSFLKLALRGAAVLVLDGGSSALEEMTGIHQHVGTRLLLIYTLPAFCLAAVGLLGLWNRSRQLFYLTFLTLAYFVGISAGADSYSRYRVPIVPVYAILIAAGVDALLKHRTPAANLGQRRTTNYEAN